MRPLWLSEFQRAAQTDEGEGGAAGESAQDPAPEAGITVQRRRRTRDRSQDVERPAGMKQSDHVTDNDGPSGDDHPTPRRRRNRDLDRER